MPRIKAPVHEQLDEREAAILPCRVTIASAPATPAQWAAWRQLWARLLRHVDTTAETPQPQGSGEPGP